MKKRVLLTLAILALFVCLFAISVSAQTPERYNEFKVLLEGDTEYTTVYSTDGGDTWTPKLALGNDFFTEPEQINLVDKTKIVKFDWSEAKAYGGATPYVKQILASKEPFTNVTEIKMPAYEDVVVNISTSLCKNWTSLTTVDFGNAKEIWDNAFEGCGFTEIVVPEQVVKFANNVFLNCKSLTKATVEGTGAGNVGSAMFQGCSALTDVTLVRIVSIGGGMFRDCSSLTKITLPETVTSIGPTVFMGTKLESLHIPAAVKSIGCQLVEDVSTFSSITFAENSQLETIAHRMFRGTAISGEIVIPSSVTRMDYSVFAGAKYITSVVLPDGLTTMGESMFSGCPALESVVFPSAITSIPKFTFNECSSLKTVTIPDPSKITSIGERAFYNCDGIVSVSFPSLTSIGSQAFGYCAELKTVDLGNSSFVKLNSAFRNCPKLESINLPDTVDGISQDGFHGCSSLTYIKIPRDATYIGNYAFNNCSSLATLDMSEAVNLKSTGNNTFNSAGITELIFPEGFESFGGFGSASKLTNVYFPNSTKTIGGIQFGKMPTYTVPLGVTVLKSKTLDYCSTHTITIHKGVTSVDVNAFFGTGITTVIYTGSEDDAVVAQIKAAASKATIVYADHCETYLNGHDMSGESVMNYVDYMTAITFSTSCQRADCGKALVDESRTIGALFTYYGYSSTENKINGIYSVAQFFGVNNENVAKYEEATGKTVRFGVVATGNAAGTAIKPLEKGGDKVISQQFNNYPFEEADVNYFSIKVNGITNELLDTSFIFCAYVDVDGDVVYIDNNTQVKELAGVSYNYLNPSEGGEA